MSDSSLVRGESFESSSECAAIQTPTGGGGHSTVQRTSRQKQIGGPDDDKRVTMSEVSQIESEVAEEAGIQSAASRAVQQFDKLSDGVRRLDGGGVEKSQEAFCKVNERQEAESRRQIAGGEETSKVSSVSKQESKQSTSVADLGGGCGIARSSVSKKSHVSEVSESSSTSSSSRRAPDIGATPPRLSNRSASLQTEGLDSYRTSERLSDRAERASNIGSSASSTAGSVGREKGGILQELEKLLAEEERYEEALRAVRREEENSSFSQRNRQIRKEVDDIVADFFDRKRERRSDRDAFFEDATRRADRLVREFTREDDDPWRGEEERWRRQRQLRQQDAEDFFQGAVKKAENLVREMRERKESRRRDEEDIFSRYEKEIDSFFNTGRRDRDSRISSALRRSNDAIDEFFGSSRQTASSRRGNLRTSSSLADDLVRDFFSDDFSGRAPRRSRSREDTAWSHIRDRNDSTHVDIDEVLSQASTVRGERPGRRADVDIEELSSSTAASSRADRSRNTAAGERGAGSSRIVDDIVRQFIADDFEDEDTLRERPPAAARQHSNTSSTGTADEQCSIRTESRMSDIDEALHMATEDQAEERRRADERAEQAEEARRSEARAEQRRKAAEARAEERRLEDEQIEARAEQRRKAAEARAEERRLEDEQIEATLRKAEERAADRRRAREQMETEALAERAQEDRKQKLTQNVVREEVSRHDDVRESVEQSSIRSDGVSEAVSRQESIQETSRQEMFQESSSRGQSAHEAVSRQESRQEAFSQQESSQKSIYRSGVQQSSTREESISQTQNITEESSTQKERSVTSTETPKETVAEKSSETENVAKEGQEGSAVKDETAEPEGGEATAEGEAGEGGVDAEAAAAALKRAEELLFGFVPDWEREEQKWSRVRTDRIADVTKDRKVRDLMSDYKPLRYHKEDDARVKQKLERKTEEYENMMGGDVWRNLAAEPKYGRSRGRGAADSVLSDLRTARDRQASSASTHRSQLQARRSEALKEASSTSAEREPVSADSSAATRRSKLDQYRSFKSELWDDK